jgi:hypothetical protein
MKMLVASSGTAANYFLDLLTDELAYKAKM